MGELFTTIIELVERTGKAGAIVCLVVGSALVPFGLWLTFVMPGEAPAEGGVYVPPGQEGERLMWPIMLAVVVAGLALIAVGWGALSGAQGKINAVLAEDPSAPISHPTSDAFAIDEMEPPFWVCGDCKIVRQGVSATGRCTSCASITSFVAVENDSDRAMARSVLG